MTFNDVLIDNPTKVYHFLFCEICLPIAPTHEGNLVKQHFKLSKHNGVQFHVTDRCLIQLKSTDSANT